MNEGKLPNLARLRANGTFRPLRPTIPAQTPVSWSTFSTGIDPGRTGIFDFLRRDPTNYMPVFAAFFVLFAMANSGLPGTSGSRPGYPQSGWAPNHPAAIRVLSNQWRVNRPVGDPSGARLHGQTRPWASLTPNGRVPSVRKTDNATLWLAANRIRESDEKCKPDFRDEG